MKSRLLVLLFALSALVVAGCGDSGSSSGPGADPAKVVPADAPLYVEALVRPDGDVGDGVRDALKKLLRTDDPGKQITALIDKAAAEENVSWDEIKQWLGKRVGLYLTEFGGEKTVGALIAESTDNDKAKATLDKLAKKDPGKVETAIIGDYAVVGTPEGVAKVRATADGGRPLTDVADYVNARKAVNADDGLGLAYVVPQGLLDALTRASASSSAGSSNPFDNPQALDAVGQVFAKAGRVAAASLHADGGAVRLDAAAIGAPAGSSGTAAADAVSALPADAWLALGFGDLGTTLTNVLGQVGQLSSIGGKGPDFEGLLARFEKKTGVNLERDFFSWMGDGAVYARGRSIADIGGVLTIASKDPAGSRKAVGILAQGLQSAGATVREATVAGYDVAIEIRNPTVPVSLFIAANGERFSVGINPKALSDVLDPGEKLGDSSTYDNATKALGGELKPVFIVDTPTIISLIEGFGVGQVPGYQKAKPYLDVLGPLAVGTAHDGDVARLSIALGLR
jgi:hypothetical protein